ncbi:hypothetical protein BH09PLA1_BH09PLA1_31060 [soil metagenome]
MDAIATTTTDRTETREPVRTPAPKPPTRSGPRITPQMIVFALLILGIFGGLGYVYLDSAISGGIKDIGNGFKQVDLKAMSTFSLDQVNGTVDDVPKKWRELDGQKVVVYGEMWEPMSAGNGRVAGFDLCYSIAKCCFSGPPQVQHFVKARVSPNHAAYYYPNQVKVSGVLHVNVVRDAEAGKLTQVYAMDVESIEPVR